VKISTFSEIPKIQRRIKKLWSATVLIFTIQLGNSIVIGLLALSGQICYQVRGLIPHSPKRHLHLFYAVQDLLESGSLPQYL